jgi:hypothetical protein
MNDLLAYKFYKKGKKKDKKRKRFKHYAKMWFLRLGQFATITQNSHVIINGLESQSFWQL